MRFADDLAARRGLPADWVRAAIGQAVYLPNVPRLMLPLSLSYDHRVIDGAAAARFTATLAQLLGDMRRVLL